MPCALFEKEAKLSRAFPTATDVWRCAEDCGLVVDGADGKPRLRTTTASSRARRTRAGTRNWARTGACKKPDLRRNETGSPKLSR
jgi:hypothetical protein